jgi:hypothetical protein
MPAWNQHRAVAENANELSKWEQTSPLIAGNLGEILKQTTGGRMLTSSKANFPHRHNPDGSHDSICATCYATVAQAQDEQELDASETAHVCHPTAHYEASHGFRSHSSSVS